MSVEVRLLGKPRITVAGRVHEPQADRRSAMLYYLAHTGGWVPREDLLYLFWPDTDEKRARTSLRQLLHQLRDEPYAAGLHADRTRLTWEVHTDLAEWRDPATTGVTRLDWPGELLDGFRLGGAPEHDSWLELEREAWRNRYRATLMAVAASEDTIDTGRVCAWLDTWLTHDPLDEEALRAWLLHTWRAGRTTAALARFTRFAARLEDEYGVEPEAATLAVVQRIRDGEVAQPTVTTDRVAARTRTSVGAFVGRGDELARLERALLDGDGVVLTILAPGGMGKTRLARHAVQRLGHRFTDGAVFVPLASIQDVRQIPPALADALGIDTVRSSSARDEIGRALAGKRMLIVLDNLEQLDGASALIDEWSAAAPATAWLLTSRAVVGATGEAILELAGLGCPAVGEEPTLEHEAVALLLDRADRAGRPLDLHRDAHAVADTARLTGGMPLAIELAAGWLRVLPLEAIVADLRTGHDLSASPGTPTDARHTSIHAVIESAWNALPTSDRDALTRLSVFEGGFDEPAAREVADVGRPQLLALRNRSMLELNRGGRFGWHPLLEVFIKERSAAGSTGKDALAEVRDRHARHYFDLMRRCEDLGQGGQSHLAITTLRTEHPNWEAAWHHAVDQGWWELLGSLGAYIGLSYHVEGRQDWFRDLQRLALAKVPRGTAPWAHLELGDAFFDMLEDRYELAYQRHGAAVDVLRPLAEEDPYRFGWALLLHGVAAANVGRLDEAFVLTLGTVREFERAGRHDMLGMPYHNLVAHSLKPADHERWYDAYMQWHAANAPDDNYASVLQIHGNYLSLMYGEHRSGAGHVCRAMDIELAAEWDPISLAAMHWEVAVITARSGDHAAALAQLDALEAYAADKLPNKADVRDYRAHADALRALMQLQHDAAADGELLEPASDAAATSLGLRVRVESALRRGDLATARSVLEQVVERTPKGPGRPGTVAAQVDTALLCARLAGAEGDENQAVAHLVSAIELAQGGHLLPSLLHALVEATEYLSEGLRSDVDMLAAASPATPHHLRHRPGQAVHSALRPDQDRESAWREASDLGVRVVDELRDVTGAGPSTPPQRGRSRKDATVSGKRTA